MLNRLILLAALLLPVGFAQAHQYKVGELEIAHPWSQAVSYTHLTLPTILLV